jgi:DNA invertase Pin-like site-specific DNA recombinase
VIDVDQGQSGASSADREGFQRLVADVSLGKAGIVLGLECSRLARNNADWHRLLELCSLSGTLICDEDGLYDPGSINDRLLLGLKGTISEAELRFSRARLQRGIASHPQRLRAAGMLTLEEIAAQLGVTAQTIKIWQRRGDITGRRIDGRREHLHHPDETRPPDTSRRSQSPAVAARHHHRSPTADGTTTQPHQEAHLGHQLLQHAEPDIECVRRTSRNVEHWQNGEMCLRRTAAGILEAEQQFRRVIGYHDLAKLAAARRARSHRSQAPNPTQRPLSSPPSRRVRKF